MPKNAAYSSFLLGALAFSAMATAQTPISRDGRVEKIGPPRSGLNVQDAKFIKDAAAGNTFEVRSSQLALKRGRSPIVKKFALRMIADHGSAFEELKLLAKRKGRPVSKTLPPKLQVTIDRLSRLQGSSFDAAYEKAQKQAHAETAQKMKREIQFGHDSDVKGYAINTLPAVQMHAKMLATRKGMPGPRAAHSM